MKRPVASSPAAILEATARGCRIVTEETQAGFAAWVLAPILRRALHHHHHPRWLAGLARSARKGIE